MERGFLIGCAIADPFLTLDFGDGDCPLLFTLSPCFGFGMTTFICGDFAFKGGGLTDGLELLGEFPLLLQADNVVGSLLVDLDGEDILLLTGLGTTIFGFAVVEGDLAPLAGTRILLLRFGTSVL